MDVAVFLSDRKKSHNLFLVAERGASLAKMIFSWVKHRKTLIDETIAHVFLIWSGKFS